MGFVSLKFLSKNVFLSTNARVENSRVENFDSSFNDHFFSKKTFFDKNFSETKPIQNHIKKCSRMILVMTLQHACSGNLWHLKFFGCSPLPLVGVESADIEPTYNFCVKCFSKNTRLGLASSVQT